MIKSDDAQVGGFDPALAAVGEFDIGELAYGVKNLDFDALVKYKEVLGGRTAGGRILDGRDWSHYDGSIGPVELFALPVGKVQAQDEEHQGHDSKVETALANAAGRQEEANGKVA